MEQTDKESDICKTLSTGNTQQKELFCPAGGSGTSTSHLKG